jgi:hypothetical protein
MEKRNSKSIDNVKRKAVENTFQTAISTAMHIAAAFDPSGSNELLSLVIYMLKKVAKDETTNGFLLNDSIPYTQMKSITAEEIKKASNESIWEELSEVPVHDGKAVGGRRRIIV